MPRGKPSPVGSVIINANGYSQTKTEEGWKGTHVVVLEEKLGRKLRANEKATFKDGNKTNLDPDNIVLTETGGAKSIKGKIAKLQAEVDDRVALIEALKLELELLSTES